MPQLAGQLAQQLAQCLAILAKVLRLVLQEPVQPQLPGDSFVHDRLILFCAVLLKNASMIRGMNQSAGSSVHYK
jgi:hypothetical protein